MKILKKWNWNYAKLNRNTINLPFHSRLLALVIGKSKKLRKSNNKCELAEIVGIKIRFPHTTPQLRLGIINKKLNGGDGMCNLRCSEVGDTYKINTLIPKIVYEENERNENFIWNLLRRFDNFSIYIYKGNKVISHLFARCFFVDVRWMCFYDEIS